MLRNATVLVVDDDPFSRAVVSRKLRGFTRAVEAADGEEALSLCLRASIDLVIADLDMPRLDGLQLVRALRGAPSTRHIPVIILTADETPDLPQKSAVAGSTSFLRKPLNWEALGDHVRHVLELAFRSNHLAFHDALTRLPNRAFLEPRHTAALAEASATALVATYALDLDGFKAVNDTFGHPGGDELLRMVAGRLRSIANGHDTIARLGGDEFVIVQAGLEDASEAEQFAQRIVAVLAEPFVIEGSIASIGVSVGIDIADAPVRTSGLAIRNADIALYRAKRGGKGTWQVFADVAAATAHGDGAASALKAALEADQLYLCYQPVYGSADGQVQELEALVRWQHPDLGLILPETILQSAQQAARLAELDTWVLRRACSDAASWTKPWPVSVNVSLEFLASPNVVDTVEQVLTASGLGPERLTLEFQEDVLRSERAAQALRIIRKLGVGLTIDDFGIGTCSLTGLNTLSVTSVKVDQMLLHAGGDSKASQAIMAALRAMAPILGFQVGAVGLETETSIDLALAMSVHKLQGFLLSGAISCAEVDTLDAATEIVCQERAALAQIGALAFHSR